MARSRDGSATTWPKKEGLWERRRNSGLLEQGDSGGRAGLQESRGNMMMIEARVSESRVMGQRSCDGSCGVSWSFHRQVVTGG